LPERIDLLEENPIGMNAELKGAFGIPEVRLLPYK